MPSQTSSWTFTGRISRLRPLLLTVLLVAGCSTAPTALPPLQTGDSVLLGKVIWHDLLTPDIERSQRFYGALFGWTFEKVASGYALARNAGEPVAGFAKLDRARDASYWMPLVSVPDVDTAVVHTDSEGGETLLEPIDIPGRGRVAVVRDPQGAAFALIHNSQGDPVDRDPVVNGWLWNEIWTDDVEASGAYYESLVGYQPLQREVNDHPYVFLARGGKARVGLVQKPDAEIGNTWVAYIKVADVTATVQKAEALGGNVLMAPRPDMSNGRIAILTDPEGAGFVVQERGE